MLEVRPIGKERPLSRSQSPRGLRCRSAVARLLRSWVRIPPWAWMLSVVSVVSGRGLCDELITCPEQSYGLWCVVVCDLKTSRMRKWWPALGRSATGKTKKTSQILFLTSGGNLLLSYGTWILNLPYIYGSCRDVPSKLKPYGCL